MLKQIADYININLLKNKYSCVTIFGDVLIRYYELQQSKYDNDMIITIIINELDNKLLTLYFTLDAYHYDLWYATENVHIISEFRGGCPNASMWVIDVLGTFEPEFKWKAYFVMTSEDSKLHYKHFCSTDLFESYYDCSTNTLVNNGNDLITDVFSKNFKHTTDLNNYLTLLQYIFLIERGYLPKNPVNNNHFVVFNLLKNISNIQTYNYDSCDGEGNYDDNKVIFLREINQYCLDKYGEKINSFIRENISISDLPKFQKSDQIFQFYYEKKIEDDEKTCKKIIQKIQYVLFSEADNSKKLEHLQIMLGEQENISVTEVLNQIEIFEEGYKEFLSLL